MEQESTLNSEQFIWLVSMTAKEKRECLKKMILENLRLVWNEDEHAFEMKRAKK